MIVLFCSLSDEPCNQLVRGHMLPPLISPEARYSHDPIDLSRDDPLKQRSLTSTQLSYESQSYQRSPSLNFDSAFDNNSPSASSSSEQGSYVISASQRRHISQSSENASVGPELSLDLAFAEGPDLDAIEEEAMAKSGGGTPRSLLTDDRDYASLPGEEDDDVMSCDLSAHLQSVTVGAGSDEGAPAIRRNSLRRNSRVAYTEVIHDSLDRRTSVDQYPVVNQYPGDYRQTVSKEISNEYQRQQYNEPEVKLLPPLQPINQGESRSCRTLPLTDSSTQQSRTSSMNSQTKPYQPDTRTPVKQQTRTSSENSQTRPYQQDIQSTPHQELTTPYHTQDTKNHTRPRPTELTGWCPQIESIQASNI